MRAVEFPHILRKGIDIEWLGECDQAAPPEGCPAERVVPTNPTGDCVPDENKAALVTLASKHKIALIESDLFGEMVFDGTRPRTLKAFDRDGTCSQCSSLAHYVAPGFNLGWIQAGRWQAEVERLKSFTNVASARLTQLALAEFLESGAFEKTLEAPARSVVAIGPVYAR
jgi:DNA-binding transcriptional MocR family regulator